MATTSNRRWKGCPLCKMHKHRGAGSNRYPWKVKRQLGQKRRIRL